MNVLSLFDGMSCGRIALDRLGIKVDNYYSSEIDKYAMKVSEANYPDIIQVGDVTQLDTSTLPKIDLIMGGSPCQGFSVAGKGLAFDDPRSALFFEFVRCVKELKPKYFLLENVNMKKEYLNIITEYMGVEGIKINSALVSAQNRQRWYWTNITGIEQPEQRGIVLKDILETNPNNYTLMSNKFAKRQEGRKCLVDMNKEKAASLSAMEYVKNGRQGDYLACNDTGIPKDLFKTHDTPKQVGIAVDIKGHDILKRVYSPDGKSPTVNACTGGNREPKVITGGALRARSVNAKGKNVAWKETKPKQMLELTKDDKSNAISSVTKDSVVVGDIPEKSQTIKAQYYKSSKANFERQGTFHATGVQSKDLTWRKLTPVECERLQTVPDNYTNHVSNTQRYKMLGNGWTIEVIAHILKKIEIDI